jgi:hypothetical protein
MKVMPVHVPRQALSGTITEGISSTGADQAWKFIAQVCHDVLEVEVAIVGLMKVYEDGHNLANA